MPTGSDSVAALLELTFAPAETPANPRHRLHLPDLTDALGDVEALYNVAPAALTLRSSLPELLAEYRWQKARPPVLPPRRRVRFRYPELDFLFRELEYLREPLPPIDAGHPLLVEHASMESPFDVLLGIPWPYVASVPTGFWLFVKGLPKLLGGVEDVALFPDRLRRRREEERKGHAEAHRDRLRAEREALDEDHLMSERQRELAEEEIEARSQQLQLDGLQSEAETKPLRLTRAKLELPPGVDEG